MSTNDAKWTYNHDGDLVRYDWSHTADSDYRPIKTEVTHDGDLMVDGELTTQQRLNDQRKSARVSDGWM